MKIIDVLQSLEWGEKNFGGLVTNRHVRRIDVLKCVSKGLAKSIGIVAVCDDDGFLIQPERYREGFKLTHKGKRFLSRFYKEENHG